MEFSLERRAPKQAKFDKDVMEIALHFTKLVHKELGSIVRAVVLFGSAVKKDDPHDIDILVIIDDLQIAFTEELQQAYRVIVENCVKATSTRLHVTTLRFSNFWEYVRTSDPVVVTVLRDGKPLIDTGFFTPLQMLLQQGRIRPTLESIWSYYARAPQLLLASKMKIMHAVIDLYWAVIDAAHAALMSAAVVPQTPEHVPKLLEEHFTRKQFTKTDIELVSKLFNLQKDVYAHRIESISARRFESLFKKADKFVKKARKIIE